jgi:hypothetical protein
MYILVLSHAERGSGLLPRVFNLAFFTHFLLLQICLQRLEKRRA